MTALGNVMATGAVPEGAAGRARRGQRSADAGAKPATMTSMWKTLLGLLPFVPAAKPVEASKGNAPKGHAQPPLEPCAVSAMFEREELIRFAHCDPAGIVFYPQYFVLLNGLVEDWFTDGLGVDSAELVTVRKMGTPTARMDCTFSRPSRLGDRLVLGLTVTKIGNSAIDLDVQGRVGDEIRLKARQTLVVCCLETMKSVPIPPEIRAGLGRYCRDGCSSEGKV